jgi:hypothetical protein
MLKGCSQALLKQVFDRFTESKAGRKYHLLIVAGLGSHPTMAFVSFCDANKMTLAVYPPHSTNTLQPLEVVCFKPLAQNYRNELTGHLHKSQGLVPIKRAISFAYSGLPELRPSWKSLY